MATTYNNARETASLHCLCESVKESGFRLFLDIEDKSESVDFDDRIVSSIIQVTYEILSEISPNPPLYDHAIYIARSSAFEKHKLHIIFKHIIVTKKIHKYIISRLKQMLYGEIGNCIDSQAITGLRMLGAKKNPTQDVREEQGDGFDIHAWRKEKGWYVPSLVYKDNMLSPYCKNLSTETLANFSIHNIDNKPVITINKHSLFWLCEMNPDVIHENPPTEFIDECVSLISDEQWVKFILLIPPSYYGENSFWRWKNLGRFLKLLDVDSGLYIWRQVSYNDVYTKEQTDASTYREWFAFEDLDEDEAIIELDEAKKFMFKVIRKHAPNDVDAFFKENMSEYKLKKKQHKCASEKYQRELASKCYAEWYEDKNASTHIERYVNKSIFCAGESLCLVSAPLGTGKTTAIIEYIASDWDTDKPIVWMTARKTFTDDLMSKLNDRFVNLEDKFTAYSSITQGEIRSKRVVVQYESLNRLHLTHNIYKDCLLISDEIESVLTQMVSKTNKHNDANNAYALETLLSISSKIIFTDAFLSNRVKQICLSIRPEISFSRHDYKPTLTRPVVVLKNTPASKKKNSRSVNALDKWTTHLTHLLYKGKRCYVFCSSKLFAEELFNEYKDKYKCLLYTSSTDERTDNVNEHWKDTRLIVTTTKITIGVDCQIVFDNVFAYINAQILTRDAIQSMFRVRNLTGTTYIVFDSRAKKTRHSVCFKTIYDKMVNNIAESNRIVNSWGLRLCRLNTSLERLRYRVYLSSIQEGAFNLTTHEQYGLYLLQKQGYNIIDEGELHLVFVYDRPINIACYNDVPLINELTYNTLITKQRINKLTELEHSQVKKYLLNFYVDVPTDEDEQNELWTKVLNHNHILDEIKHLSHLARHDKDTFCHLIGVHGHSEIITNQKQIMRKEVFDNVVGWFKKNNLTIAHGTSVTREQLRDLYLQTESLDYMFLKLAKFNPKCKERYLVDRVNAFFNNIIEGYKFKAGLLEDLENEDGKRVRTRKRNNGKRVYDTTYTLLMNGTPIYSILKK
jgi:hypothetical protein